MSQTTSHSELFGLDGQKRPSTTAGAGAGSGILGTSGHAGAANRRASGAVDSGAVEGKVADIAEEGTKGTVPGSGSDTFTPSQGSGAIQDKQ